MTLILLALFAYAEDSKTTKIDFESVEVQAGIKKPKFQYISEVKRPQFQSIVQELCNRTSFIDMTATLKGLY